MDTQSLIKKVKEFFEQENNKDTTLDTFSDEVIKTAYQKLQTNFQETIQVEDDPMVITELLKNYLEVTKMINEKDLPKQQYLLKLFEQLNKYEQSRYF